MRMLFLLSADIRRDGYIGIFASEFAAFLSIRHLVSVVEVLREDELVDLDDADVILVMDAMALSVVEKNIDVRFTPVIFVTHNTSWKTQPYLIKNMVAVFSTCGDFVYNVPSELIRYFARPLLRRYFVSGNSERDREQDGPLRILHFYQEEDDDLSIVGSVIEFANRNPSFRFTVVADGLVVSILRRLVNSNVVFLGRNEIRTVPMDFDLVIAADDIATEAMVSGIPTMIAGRRGFGGLVTSANVKECLDFHFSGRLGGEIGEPIPYWLLFDEIERFQVRRAVVVADNPLVCSMITAARDADAVFSSLEREILGVVGFNGRDSEAFTCRRPVLSKGIQVVPVSTRGTFHVVDHKGKVLGVISHSEKTILQACDGSRVINDFCALLNTNIEEVGDFFQELKDEKIIYFLE